MAARHRCLRLLLAAAALLEACQAQGFISTPSDEELLLDFKASFANGEQALAEWNSTTPLCQWAGVTCNAAGRVDSLNLEAYGLEGSIPSPNGWALPDTLVELQLRNNLIGGTLPTGLYSALPPRLRTLDLSDNQIKGRLATGALPDTLETLSLGDNELSGPIPQEWQLPPLLKNLDLGSNKLTGGVPAGLALPPSLLSLSLGFNPLRGTIPSNWSLPGQLTSLNLPTCQLSGPIPSDWRLPPSLEMLALSDNLLTGSLDFDLPPSLMVLSMDRNAIGGTIPASWVLPESLMVAVLTSNNLTGPIPSNWTLPARLQTLALNKNQLTSTIPLWPFLVPLNFDISNNRLTGQLPPGWQINAGGFVAVFNNSLSGPLPSNPNSTARLYIQPGNLGLCGEVPQAPRYLQLNGPPDDFSQVSSVRQLPACPEQPTPPAFQAPSPPGPEAEATDSNAGLSGGAIAGIVVGSIAAIVGACSLVWWAWRRLRRPAADAHLNGRSTGPNIEYKSSTALRGDDIEMAGDVDPSGPVLSPELLAADPFLSTIVNSLQRPASGTLTQAKGTGSKALDTSSGNSTWQEGPGSSEGSKSSNRLDRLERGVEAWSCDFSELDFDRLVGKGSFGRVYAGRWKQMQVAIKVLAPDAEGEAPAVILSPPRVLIQELKKEANMLASMRHPNILGFLGMSLQPPALVLEYCPKGSLYAVLCEARASPMLLDWTTRLKLARGTALAMLYLHTFEPPIVHRDLKSPNILIADNWVPKVSDFNMSKIVLLDDASKSSSIPAVTQPRWLAPEVIVGGSNTFASDVFSFAVIMWELLTLDVPWGKLSNPWQVVHVVTNNGRLPVPDAAAVPGGAFEGLDTYVELMQRCWAQDPDERPGFDEIVKVLQALSEQVEDKGKLLEECTDRVEAPPNPPARLGGGVIRSVAINW